MNPRILVWRNGKLGNTIAAIPCILELRRLLPEALIAVAVEPLGAELLKHYPEINELVVYDKRGAQRGLFAHLQFITALRARRFTHSFHIKRFFRNEFLSWLAGIPYRIGFERETGGRGLLTWTAKYDESLNIVQCNLSLLRFFDPRAGNQIPYRFYSSQADRAEAESFLAESKLSAGRYAVFHCGGETVRNRGASAEAFATLAQWLSREKELVPLFLSGPGEAAAAGKVLALLPVDIPRAVCAVASIRVNAEITRRSALFIGSNSGQAHLAALVGRPLLVLYRQQDDTGLMLRKWRPWSDLAGQVVVRDQPDNETLIRESKAALFPGETR